MTEPIFNHGAGRTVAGAEHDVDSFTRHRTQSRSSDLIIKGEDWKKTGLRLWLHTKAPIASVWHHQFYKVIEKREDKEKLPIFFKWNCWEDEEVLVDRFKRRRDGSRVTPPCHCPFCLVAEQIRSAVVAGEIKWTSEVFVFEGDNRANTKILRAGDFWNAFSSRDLEDEEVAELRRAGVNRSDAWKTSLQPKCEYVFIGADDDHLSEGCRIVIGNSSIGEAMQDAIKREQKRQGRELGNPRANPYLFEWTHDDRAKRITDQYTVDVLGKKPSEEVLKIIREQDPADASDLVARGDADELRSLMEGHCVFDRKLLQRLLDASFPKRDDARKGAAPVDPEPPPEDRFDCDNCGEKEVMGIEDLSCPKCHAEYAIPEGGDGAAYLVRRPCASVPEPGKPACNALVDLGNVGDVVTCPKCKAEHREEAVSEGGQNRVDWVFIPPKVVEQPSVAAKTVGAKDGPQPARRRTR